MAASMERLEELFGKKIELYNRLIDVLEAEKTCLRNSDVDALWRFTDEKQDISNKIQYLRQSVLAVLSGMGVDHGIAEAKFRLDRIEALLPGEMRPDFGALRQQVEKKKRKVYALSKANKEYVEEYLSVLDELIGIITTAGGKPAAYDRGSGAENRGRANLLLHREV